MLLVASCTVAMFAVCTNPDANTPADKQQAADVQEVATPKNNAQNTTQLVAANVKSGDTKSYYTYLKPDKNKTVDLGRDGNMDNLHTYICPQKGGPDKLYLQYNDKTICATRNYESAELSCVFYVHKPDEDYILIDTADDGCVGNLELYLWNNETSDFVKIDELEDRGISKDWNNGDVKIKITNNTIKLVGWFDVFATQDIDRNYYYGKNGFSPKDKYYRIHDVAHANSDSSKGSPLVLKQPLAVYNSRTKVTTTLEVGQKVFPYKTSDPCDYNEGFKAKGNYMSFVNENGEFLGSIEYELRKGGNGCVFYNGEQYTPYVNGIKDEDLFDGTIHVS